jgi:hypothetical protein
LKTKEKSIERKVVRQSKFFSIFSVEKLSESGKEMNNLGAERKDSNPTTRISNRYLLAPLKD